MAVLTAEPGCFLLVRCQCFRSARPDIPSSGLELITQYLRLGLFDRIRHPGPFQLSLLISFSRPSRPTSGRCPASNHRSAISPLQHLRVTAPEAGCRCLSLGQIDTKDQGIAVASTRVQMIVCELPPRLARPRPTYRSVPGSLTLRTGVLLRLLPTFPHGNAVTPIGFRAVTLP
jgi:hypothetical protein